MHPNRDSPSFVLSLLHVGGLALVLAVSLPASVAAFDPFTVEGLEIGAEAEDAVAAKAEALSRATVEGLARVLNRVVDSDARARLPEISVRQAENFLDRLSIDSETLGIGSYRGRFTVAFSPIAVRGYLAARDVSIIDEPAPLVLLIPVLVEHGIPLWWNDAERWASALENAQFKEGLTPVRLVDGSRADRAEPRDRVLGGDRFTLLDFRLRYETQGAVVVIAERAQGRERIELTLVGHDAAGPIDLTETVYGALDQAADRAAELFSERWKDSVGARRPLVQPNRPPLTVRVLIHAEAEEWAEIRRRLEASGALNAVAVERIDARSADILIWPDDEAHDLARALQRHGLDLFEAGGSWLLQSY